MAVLAASSAFYTILTSTRLTPTCLVSVSVALGIHVGVFEQKHFGIVKKTQNKIVNKQDMENSLKYQ